MAFVISAPYKVHTHAYSIKEPCDVQDLTIEYKTNINEIKNDWRKNMLENHEYYQDIVEDWNDLVYMKNPYQFGEEIDMDEFLAVLKNHMSGFAS